MANRSDVKKRIAALRSEIARHDQLYYVEAAPEISDKQYDRLFAKLELLEQERPDLVTPDSPTQRLGVAPRTGLEKISHIVPMLSLNAVRNEADVEGFLARIRTETGEDEAVIWAEPKFDGLSVEVVYENGHFDHASTRGDGRTGEGIGHTLRAARALPLRLRHPKKMPDVLVVRGEALLLVKSFQKLNRARVERGEEPFANPRNAAAGLLRRLDPAGAEGICFAVTFYDATGLSIQDAPTQETLLKQLEHQGLPVFGVRARCVSMENIRAFHKRLVEARDQLPYEIDGMVLKLDDRAAREDMGTRARSPRWALAWKFEPRHEITRIADIAVSVGRTGALTPVALLDPVDVGGITVARATLHNQSEIRRKDLRVGDTVRIERAGDVIPEVVGRVDTPGQKRGDVFEMPKMCPACGAELEKRGRKAYCPAGIACPAQLVGRIVHYAARGAMDIDGLGEKTASQLVERGMVKTLADLYDISAEDFKTLEGFAAKSAKALFDAIQNRTGVPLDRFVWALGIRHVGSDSARQLARAFGSLKALLDASEDDISAVLNIGPKTAASIVGFFAEWRNRDVVDRLLAAGISPQPVEKTGSTLEDRTFVLTGALAGWTRAQASQEIERRGGRVTTTVSDETDYLVVGERPGSKLEQAKRHGVRTLDETDFRKLLGQGG